MADIWDIFVKYLFPILTALNTLLLVRNHMSNKVKLFIKPIFPNQDFLYWTQIPDIPSYDGMKIIRVYIFISYIRIINRGNKDVELDEWYLEINDALAKKRRLNPSPIHPPRILLQNGAFIEYPVLGVRDNLGSLNLVAAQMASLLLLQTI